MRADRGGDCGLDNACGSIPMAPAGLRLLAGIVFFNAQQYIAHRGARSCLKHGPMWIRRVNICLLLLTPWNGDTERARLQVGAADFRPAFNLAQYRLAYGDQYKLNTTWNISSKGCGSRDSEWSFGFEAIRRIV